VKERTRRGSPVNLTIDPFGNGNCATVARGVRSDRSGTFLKGRECLSMRLTLTGKSFDFNGLPKRPRVNAA
jgi:hypothetical protein